MPDQSEGATMDMQLYFAFVSATIVLALIPGPNVAVIVANSVAYGARFGLLTVAGTSTAIMVQLALAGFGMSAVLDTLGDWFEWVRWIGAAYLVYLGVIQWRAAPVDLAATAPQARSARAVYGRGLLVALANPKTLLFYSAFLPQFVTPDGTLARQLILLSTTCLVVAIAIDSGWALLAARARRLLARGRLRNRLSGGLLIGAGLGLALARHR
jgi:threonine/homoserine/homoserine lactone efflux protein